jgi:hypothetical protein
MACSVFIHMKEASTEIGEPSSEACCRHEYAMEETESLRKRCSWKRISVLRCVSFFADYTVFFARSALTVASLRQTSRYERRRTRSFVGLTL